jgi:hypothetical protein
MAVRTGRLAALVLVTALVLVVAACGSSGKSGSSTSSGSQTTSAVDWANSVCSAVTTWTTSIKKTGNDLRGGTPTKAKLQSAANDFKQSTQQLADDLKGLGRPDVAGGDKAQAAVDKLATQVQSDSNTVKDDVAGASGLSGYQQALTSISTTLTQMGTEVSAAFSKLGTIDAKGKLEDAFKKADKCTSFVGSSG